MKKAAPVKESGLYVMQGQSNKKLIGSNPKSIVPLAINGYRSFFAANSATGCGSPASKRSISSHIPARSFFSPAFYGGAVREAFAPAGFLLPRSSTLAQCYRPSCGSDAGSFLAKGAISMRPTLSLNPIKARAAAHKAMAFAALHTNSSLHVRMNRYNDHMQKARDLEVIRGVL